MIIDLLLPVLTEPLCPVCPKTQDYIRTRKWRHMEVFPLDPESPITYLQLLAQKKTTSSLEQGR